jgi:exodeoxyribonuclease I
MPCPKMCWGLDLETALAHADVAAAAGLVSAMSTTWRAVFQRPAEATPDVDEDLYGGFIGNKDRGQLNRLRTLTPQQLAEVRPGFEDGRLEELLFRYRARNFPATLSNEDAQRWEEHRAARLFDGADGARTIAMLFEEIDRLSETADERGEELLGSLYDYAETIAPERN